MMSFQPTNRRWGTLVFIAGIVVLGAITVPWCQMLPGLPGCRPSQPALPTGSITPAVAPSAMPDGAVEVRFYSANTKQDWIDAVTASFNAAQIKTSLGHPIFVIPAHGTSGGALREILEGSAQPHAWSPGDQSWIDRANQGWQQAHGQPLVPDDCRATVRAPIGFAMWRPMAEAMGWPNSPIGWDELATLAADPRGWERYNHPEWGQFQFGHTHPAHSNSGLLTLTALVHDTLDQVEPLAVEQVFDPAVVAAMRSMELHTYHYGIQSRVLLDLMVRRGASYLHAVNTTEAETLKTNAEHAADMDFPLAFIVPTQGTYWTEQPYCVLDAEWVTDEQQEAARLYGDYLLQPEQQRLTVENYVRPIDTAIPLVCPVCLEQGTDQRISPDSVPNLESPSVEVAEAVEAMFLQTKRKATVIVVLDVSSSMGEGVKLTNAVSATIGFLGKLHPGDAIVVVSFNDKVNELQPSGRAGEVSEELAQTLSGLYASKSTALFDAVCTAVDLADSLKAADEAAGDERLYGVVLLSDGDDTASTISEEEMFATCLPSGEAVEGVRVFTIAYGDDAVLDLLQRLANRTNGKFFTGDPATIEDVYEDISAEQ
jgi:Ca-activated chloride channel homolog